MKLNIIHKGDFLDLYKTMPPKSVDLILADLPYGTTSNKWDVVIPIDKMWECFRFLLKENGVIALTACQPFTSLLVSSNLIDFKYDLIWNKRRPTGQLNCKKQPLRQHEHILIFYKKQPTFNPIFHENRLKRAFLGKIDKTNKQSDNYNSQYNYESNIKEDDKSYPRSIIEQTAVIGNSSEKLKHPTQKPVALFEWLIETYTNVGDLVFDPCIGSGTTAVAALQTGRNFVGVEKNDTYFKMANDRLTL